MNKTKKIIIIASMVLILAVAAVLNVLLLSGGGDGGEDSLTTGNFFMSYRTVRQETRTEEIAALDKIIALQGDEFADARKDAAEQKVKIVKLMETELVLECIIKSRGYEDAVVSMGIFSDVVTVMVKHESITKEDTAIIYGIIAREASSMIENVFIYPV